MSCYEFLRMSIAKSNSDGQWLTETEESKAEQQQATTKDNSKGKSKGRCVTVKGDSNRDGEE